MAPRLIFVRCRDKTGKIGFLLADKGTGKCLLIPFRWERNVLFIVFVAKPCAVACSAMLLFIKKSTACFRLPSFFYNFSTEENFPFKLSLRARSGVPLRTASILFIATCDVCEAYCLAKTRCLWSASLLKNSFAHYSIIVNNVFALSFYPSLEMSSMMTTWIEKTEAITFQTDFWLVDTFFVLKTNQSISVPLSDGFLSES